MSAGLYVHIPFCLRKCAYCDFVSFADLSNMQPYLDALDREIVMRSKDSAFSSFDTVFIGGGTPSLLSPEAFARILDRLRASFDISDNAEISMESNPGTLDAKKLRQYRASGVNRLSMGLQSSDDALLSRIGRIHTYADFLNSYELARSAGFDNINVDIMYGLPGQSVKQYEGTLQTLCSLSPAHISAYSLILEENTPLFSSHGDLPGEDETYAMHVLSREFLADKDYERYEISNYALPGRECRHNLHYWNDENYLGLGLNAHSAWRLDGKWTRFANTAALPKYIEKINAGEFAEAENTQIAFKDEMFEFIMLGLRKTAGISYDAFQKRFNSSVAQSFPRALHALREQGYICEDNEFLRLNERGLDMQNRALLLFMDE